MMSEEYNETAKSLRNYGYGSVDERQTEYGTATTSSSSSSKNWCDVKSASLRQKRVYTLFICLVFLSLGINFAISGPTFLDILSILQVSVERGSLLFTSAGVGFLVGSLICGFALEKINQELLLFCSLFGMSVFTIIMPWIESLPLMALVKATANLFFGLTITAGNAVCLLMWEADVGPYMQTIHFAHAAGGLIAPMIAQPFLVEETNSITEIDSNEPNISINLYGVLNEECDSNCTQSPQPETHVQFAFMIAGSTAIFISFTFLFMYFKDKQHVKEDRTLNEDVLPEQQLTLISKILYLVLLAMFFAFYCGIEDTYASFLATFVVKYSGWSKSDASSVTSVFWGTFAVSRLLSIYASRIISPGRMLLGDFVLLLVSLFLLCLLTHVTVILWTASALMGISMGSVYPSAFTWASANIMKVGGRIASLFLVSATAGTMCNPLLVGYLFDHVTPMWLIWLLSGEAVFNALIFIALSIIVKFRYGMISPTKQP